MRFTFNAWRYFGYNNNGGLWLDWIFYSIQFLSCSSARMVIFRVFLSAHMLFRIVASFLLVFGLNEALAEDQSSLPRSLVQLYASIPESYWPVSLKDAVASFSHGDFSTSLEKIDKLKSSSKRLSAPDRIEFLRALDYQAMGDQATAILAFKDSLRLRGSSADTLFFLGISQVLAGDLPASNNSFQDAVWFGKSQIISPSDLNLFLGYSYRLNNLPTKATTALNTALSLNPANNPAKVETALLSLQGGTRSSATSMLRQALAASPSDIVIKLKLSEALLLNADRTINRSDILEAKRLSFEVFRDKDTPAAVFPQARLLYIRALIANGDLVAAKKTIDEALFTAPSDEALLALANQIKIEQESVEPSPTPSEPE